MANLVPIGMLKPHPKNVEYFSEPPPEKYEEIRRSIEAEGIRDPLRVTPDYTVISGHLRLRIAKELGLTHVPVEIWDVDPERAEYLLIADNEERRYCQDPVKKAKRAEFLRRYWGVREGKANPKGTVIRRQDQNDLDGGRTLADVAEALGETEITLKRLLKLNDLIPPLQDLVSRGELPQTAAYSLAFLPPEQQERLLEVLGKSGLCGLSVEKARELRRQLDAERARAVEVERRVLELESQLRSAWAGSQEAQRLAAELERLRAENEALQAREPEVVEEVVEKVVWQRDPATEREIARLTKQAELLEAELSRLSAPLHDMEELERQIRRRRMELACLHRTLSTRRHLASLLKLAGKILDPLHKEKDVFFEHLSGAEFTPLAREHLLAHVEILRLFASRIDEALKRGTVVIDVVPVMAGAGVSGTFGERQGGEDDEPCAG